MEAGVTVVSILASLSSLAWPLTTVFDAPLLSRTGGGVPLPDFMQFQVQYNIVLYVLKPLQSIGHSELFKINTEI